MHCNARTHADQIVDFAQRRPIVAKNTETVSMKICRLQVLSDPLTLNSICSTDEKENGKKCENICKWKRKWQKCKRLWIVFAPKMKMKMAKKNAKIFADTKGPSATTLQTWGLNIWTSKEGMDDGSISIRGSFLQWVSLLLHCWKEGKTRVSRPQRPKSAKDEFISMDQQRKTAQALVEKNGLHTNNRYSGNVCVAKDTTEIYESTS